MVENTLPATVDATELRQIGLFGGLTDEGLQSDARYAGSFVQSRINQGKGPIRIRQELKERGFDFT